MRGSLTARVLDEELFLRSPLFRKTETAYRTCLERGDSLFSKQKAPKWVKARDSCLACLTLNSPLLMLLDVLGIQFSVHGKW